MKIIAALAKQIRGELHFAKGDRDRGTRFSVTFNLAANEIVNRDTLRRDVAERQ